MGASESNDNMYSLDVNIQEQNRKLQIRHTNQEQNLIICLKIYNVDNYIKIPKQLFSQGMDRIKKHVQTQIDYIQSPSVFVTVDGVAQQLQIPVVKMNASECHMTIQGAKQLYYISIPVESICTPKENLENLIQFKLNQQEHCYQQKVIQQPKQSEPQLEQIPQKQTTPEVLDDQLPNRDKQQQLQGQFRLVKLKILSQEIEANINTLSGNTDLVKYALEWRIRINKNSYVIPVPHNVLMDNDDKVLQQYLQFQIDEIVSKLQKQQIKVIIGGIQQTIEMLPNQPNVSILVGNTYHKFDITRCNGNVDTISQYIQGEIRQLEQRIV